VSGPERLVDFGVNAVYISTPTDKKSLDGVWKASGVSAIELKTASASIRWWSFSFKNASSRQEIFSNAPKLEKRTALRL
jgi:hypothetical protein